MSSKRQIGKSLSFSKSRPHNNWEWFSRCLNDILIYTVHWYKFEKRWADVFQIYPNAIHFNPPQFCPSLSLLSFPVFWLSSAIVLSRFFVISLNSMTTWSMVKLPKIVWPSPFNTSILEEENYFKGNFWIMVFMEAAPPVSFFCTWLLRQREVHTHKRFNSKLL